MDSANFVKQYFDKAKKIYEICIDRLGLKVEDARLYVYIYVKSVENNGLDYFSKIDSTVIESIRILMKEMGENTDLSNKLKLHTDKDYLSKKISFYIDNIKMELQ